MSQGNKYTEFAALIVGEINRELGGEIADLKRRLAHVEGGGTAGGTHGPQPAPAPDVAEGQGAEAWRKQAERWRTMYELSKNETASARENHVRDLKELVRIDKGSDRLRRFSERAAALKTSKATQAETKAATKPKRAPARQVKATTSAKGKQ